MPGRCFKPTVTQSSRENKLNKQINKLDQKIETDAFTNELLNVNATNGAVWKFVTPFKKKTKSIPSLNEPADIDNTDLEKANFLAESLETVYSKPYYQS
ncbi:hypothetical protein AVEN_25818-1 [Araneus ventricosus]|uniref:Uncharacterized protein n=1 Tax=Araneus ventricosus TaxID=182803 RepID=A0A4Y2STK6_ARAVE|nr:hypothetical protein AVEN_25818-1 [Araneus ventricosus]